MFQRIVLALDAGDAGEAAASYTVSLVDRRLAVVRVVHVTGGLFGHRHRRGESPVEAAGVVLAALTELRSAGIRASGATYRTGVLDVASAIADAAETWRADVIVVGSRRRRFASPLRRGVRERVARRTSLPMLTAPPPLRVDHRQPLPAGGAPRRSRHTIAP